MKPSLLTLIFILCALICKGQLNDFPPLNRYKVIKLLPKNQNVDNREGEGLKIDRCKLRLKKGFIIDGKIYTRISLCREFGRNIVRYFRIENSSIYIRTAVDSLELKIADFNSETGDCWMLDNVLDKTEICNRGSYQYMEKDVKIFAVKYLNNVSDYPLIFEYHLSNYYGVMIVRFSYGLYQYDLISVSMNDN